MPHPITLFGLTRSVYTRVARLALEEKAVPYLLEEVEIFGPEGVPAEHLARHPMGRIPVLTHGDFALYETSAICRYVDEAFPGPSLQPQSPRERARMAQIIGLLDSYGYRPMVWGIFVEKLLIPLAGGETNTGLVSASLKDSRTVLAALDALAENTQFLLGASLSLADIHAYPMLRLLSLVPEGMEAIAEHPTLANWLVRFGARPSVQRTSTAYEHPSFGVTA